MMKCVLGITVDVDVVVVNVGIILLQMIYHCRKFDCWFDNWVLCLSN